MAKLRTKMRDIWKLLTSSEYIVISSKGDKILHISLQVEPMKGIDMLVTAEEILDNELDQEADEQIEILVNHIVRNN
jgi:intergrase/recombinase